MSAGWIWAGAPVLALALLLFVPDHALGALAATEGYAADPGERNTLTVTFLPGPDRGQVRYADSTAFITPSEGCSADDSHTVRCPAPMSGGTNATMGISLDDGDDAVTVTNSPTDPRVFIELYGGDGNDSLTMQGSPLGTFFSGGPGDDVETGGPHEDTFWEYRSDIADHGDSGYGADTIRGDSRYDTVDYQYRAAEPLRINQDGVANDGAPGERDNITGGVSIITGPGDDEVWVAPGSGVDLEDGNDIMHARNGTSGDGGTCGDGFDRADGDPGDDLNDDCEVRDLAKPSVTPCANKLTAGPQGAHLVGTSASDLLLGRRGDDVLEGRGDDDCLRGGRGRDRLLGGPGDDALDGGRGDDRLKGGSGNDRLHDLAGRDRLFGGGGRDTIETRDNRVDRISCGPGRDTVLADRVDRVARDCERVKRRRA